MEEESEYFGESAGSSQSQKRAADLTEEDTYELTGKRNDSDHKQPPSS